MKSQTVRLTGPKQRAYAHQLISEAPDDWVMSLVEPRRTTEQNDRFWAMVGDLMRAKPEGRDYPKNIWKALLMAEAGFKPIFEHSLDGLGVIPIGYKSSRLTKAEFSDLIEAAYAYGAHHGVVWTEPTAEQRRAA